MGTWRSLRLLGNTRAIGPYSVSRPLQGMGYMVGDQVLRLLEKGGAYRGGGAYPTFLGAQQRRTSSSSRSDRNGLGRIAHGVAIPNSTRAPVA